MARRRFTLGRQADGLLAIDPGLNSLGYALWTKLDMSPTTTSIPSTVGLVKFRRDVRLPNRSRYLASELDRILGDRLLHYLPGTGGEKIDIVCEFPAWHGSQMGWAAGDLQKLVFLVGVLAGYFHRSGFTEVTPAGWKGQLPKHVVIRRLQKKFGPGATREWEKDMWDAVGIGLWHLGRF